MGLALPLAACTTLSGLPDYITVAGGSGPDASDSDSEVPADEADSATTDPPGSTVDDAGNDIDEADADTSEPFDDAGEADSGLIDSNTRRVFVTSSGKTGNMGGRAAADAFCNSSATNAGLTGEWVAWLSTTSQEAIARITHAGRYVLVDGTEVVADRNQLENGALTNPITKTEYGTLFASTLGDKDIWTGTNASRGDNSGSSCSDWTSSSSTNFGTRGNAASTTRPEWTQVEGFLNGGWGCQVNHSFYCFEL